jgi:hypothetical protein
MIRKKYKDFGKTIPSSRNPYRFLFPSIRESDTVRAEFAASTVLAFRTNSGYRKV